MKEFVTSMAKAAVSGLDSAGINIICEWCVSHAFSLGFSLVGSSLGYPYTEKHGGAYITQLPP